MGKPFFKNHVKSVIGREKWSEFEIGGKVYSVVGVQSPEVIVTELCDFEFPEAGIEDALKALVKDW